MLVTAKGGLIWAIAERVGNARGTAGKWRERIARVRLDGLYYEPCAERPRDIGDAEIADTIRRTLEARQKRREQIGATEAVRRGG